MSGSSDMGPTGAADAASSTGLWQTMTSYCSSCCGGSDEAENSEKGGVRAAASRPGQDWFSQQNIDKAKLCFALVVVENVTRWRNEKLESETTGKPMKVVAYIVSELVFVFAIPLSLIEGLVREAIAWALFAFVSCGLIENDSPTSLYAKVENGARFGVAAGLISLHASFQNLNPKQDVRVSLLHTPRQFRTLDGLLSLSHYEYGLSIRLDIYQAAVARERIIEGDAERRRGRAASEREMGARDSKLDGNGGDSSADGSADSRGTHHHPRSGGGGGGGMSDIPLSAHDHHYTHSSVSTTVMGGGASSHSSEL